MTWKTWYAFLLMSVYESPPSSHACFLFSVLWWKRFLRCSPFDEFKLWKSQVDNGSKKGGERLNILTRTLLLRRTKDQLDSAGKPLVIPLTLSLGGCGGQEGGWPCSWLGLHCHSLCFKSSWVSHAPTQRPVSCCPAPGVIAVLFCGVLQPFCSQGRVGAAVQGLTRFPVSTLGNVLRNMQLIVELHCSFFCLSLFQVVLPQRKFQLHHLKLSEDEETVYSVLFARSRYVQWRSTFSQLLFYSCSCLGLSQGSSNCSYGIIDKLNICGPFYKSSLVLSPCLQLTFASYTQWACSLAFLHGRSRLCTLSPGLPGRCGAVLGKYWPT